jgi:hypothetical protein
MTEATATCRFDEIQVEFVGSKVFDPKALQDVPFEVTWKNIFVSSGYRISWKNITLVECPEEGEFCLRLESTKQNFSCQLDHHPSSPSWLKCRKLLQHIWKKKQRKLEKEKQKEQQQQALEHKKQKKSAATTTTSWKRRNNKSYSKRPLKFLMANQNNNQWNSDDDEEDGVFNQGGHKKRRQEQEPVDLDGQLLQEQAAERSVEDVDLQEMELEQQLEEQPQDAGEEQPQDAGEAEFQDAGEEQPQDAGEAEFQDEDEPSLDEEQELVQETTTPKARSKRRLLKKKRPRVQLDSDDEDDLFSDPKVTTPGIQTRRVVSPSLANLSRLDDDDDDDDEQQQQDGTPMHQDQEEGPEEPNSPEETEDPAQGHAKISTFFNLKKKPQVVGGTMNVTTEPRFKSPKKPTVTEPRFKSPSENTASASKEPTSTNKKPTNLFFAPRRPVLLTPKKKSRSTQDTLESPDTSTVVPSTAESILDDSQTTVAATPPPKKTPYRLEFEPNVEEEDPIQDDDDDTNVVIVPKIRVLAKPQIRRSTYGRQSSSTYLTTTPKKTDTATMALELTTPPRVVDNYLTRPPPLKCSWRGLRNLGNTCYMNASIQMLLSGPQFVHQLDPYKGGRRLVSSLCSLAQDLNDREQVGAATAKALKLAVDDQTDKFRGYQQRDAHEFLGDLLDKLHIELEGSKEKKDEVADEKKEEPATEEEPPLVLPTDEHFHLTVEVCLTCKSCGYAR